MQHHLFKKLAVVIALLILAELLLTVPKLFAAAPPGIIIAPNSVRGYHFVLQESPTEDILIILRFDLVADGVAGDGDWDDFTSVDAILRLEDSSGNLLTSSHPLRIGQGLAGFYFASTTLFSFEDNLFVAIRGNPITFNPVGGAAANNLGTVRSNSAKISRAITTASFLNR